MENLKLFYFINFVLLVLSFSGCNVVEQSPVPSETSQTASNVVASSSLNKSIYSFNTSLTTVVENATEYSFYLGRDNNALDAQTVLVTVGGDSEATVDWSNFEVNGLPANIYEFDPLVYEVPFKQGEKKVQITVRILEDSHWEKDERLSFSITEHFDYFYDIQSPSLFTIKILNDDDYPQVSFNSTLPSVNEGDSTTVEIQLSNSSDQDVRVPIQISGSASSSDHDLTEQVIIIPAGSMSETVEINAASDSIDELDETLILTLTTPMGAELAATNLTETVTITDVSLDPELNFKAENDCDNPVAAASIDEDSGSYVLTLCLNTSDYAQSFDVPFVLSGSALKTVDYTLSDNRFRFDPNSTDPNKATIILTTKDDLLYEGKEDITLTISDHAYAVAGSDKTITIDITENEAPSVVTLNSGNYQAQEGQTYYLNFSFNNASSTSFTRYLCIADASTASSDDHTLTHGQEIAIPEGVTSYQHPIFIKNDSLHDSNETLIVSMDDDADCSSPEAPQTITIREQGSIPKLEFETVMQEGVEGSNVSVKLKLDRASGRDQTFSVQIQHASSSGTDISATTDHTIPEGDTEYAFDITLNADGIDEPSEQFIIKLLQPSDLSLGTKLSQVVTIRDNDPASVADLTIPSINGNDESDQTADFTVTLNKASAFDITIPFTLAGSATLDEDYTLSANHFFIPAGALSATITATIIDDDIYDPNENITLTLDPGDNYSLGKSYQLVSLIENKAEPVATLSSASFQAQEGSTYFLNISLDHASSSTLTRYLCIDDASTASAADHDLTDNEAITIPAEVTSYQHPIAISSDSDSDSGETLIVSMSKNADCSNPGAFQTITLVDASTIPVLALDDPSQTANEGDDITVSLTLNQASSEDQDFNVVIQHVSTSENDFSMTTSHTIPAGDTTYGIDVKLSDDMIDEPTESFKIILLQPTGLALGTNIEHDVTINDINDPSEANLTASGIFTESDGSILYTVTLDRPSAYNITIPYSLSGDATEGEDYTLSAKEFYIPAGSLSATITATVIDDDIYDPAEEITLELNTGTNYTLGTSTQTNVIIENKAEPVATLSSASFQAQEGSTYFLNISLDHASSSTLTRYLCIDDASTASAADHDLTDNKEITIPDGATSYQYPIAISSDGDSDSGETLIVSMSKNADCSNPGASQTITLVDASTIPVLAFDATAQTANEGGEITVSLTLDQASSENQNFNVVIEHDSTSATDFSMTTSHTISAGETTYDIKVYLTADLLDEPTESFKIILLQPTGLALGTKEHEVTITDINAPSEASLTASGIFTESDGSILYTVTLDRPSAYNITIPYTLSGDATEGEDYTLSAKEFYIPAGSLSATISANIINDSQFDPDEDITLTLLAGSHYTLTAAEDSQELTITENDAIPTVNYVRAAMTVNENDIATVSFELDRPTYADVVVTYKVDFACAAPATGNDIDENDISVNTNYNSTAKTGTFTISEGSTRGVINLNIIADGIYELGTPECFTIEVTGTDNNSVATIGSNSTTTITINDINVAPNISFHPENKFLVATEGVERVLIPIYLSTKVGEPITFLISAREASESIYPADCNDFNLEENTDYGTENRSEVCAINNLETIELTIPAGSNMAYLPIALNGASNDNLYEGPEIIELVLENGTGDDSGATYSVDTNIASDSKARNIFTLEIADDEPYPQVSIYYDTNSSSTIGTLKSNHTVTELDLNSATPTDPLNTAEQDFAIKVEPILQHQSVTVEVSFGGDAERAMSGDWSAAIYNFNLYDYRIGSNTYTSTVSRTIPKMDQYAQISIHRFTDVRYEDDETIIATINSVTNASTSTNIEASITIVDDDPFPEIFFHYTHDSIAENDYGKEFIISAKHNVYPDVKFLAASEKDLDFTFTAEGSYRSTTGTQEASKSYTLTSNTYNYQSIFITPAILGDLRLYESIVFEIQVMELVNIGTPMFPLYTPMYITKDTHTTSITIPDMIINVSKVSSEDSDEIQGHTCMAYRGLATCFGENQYGQLGRNNTDDWGGDTIDFVELINKNYTLDLDNHEEYDVPLYVNHLALGKDHTCAAFNNQKIKCWGRNDYGQLGLGLARSIRVGDDADEVGPELAYVDIGMSENDTIEGLYAMQSGTCAWVKNKGVKCWGRNNYKQLGNEETTDLYVGDSPDDMGENLVKVDIDNTISLFSTGANHACALETDNQLRCWGHNINGQLGVNNNSNQYPDNGLVDIDDENAITSISAGEIHTCITYNSFSFSKYFTYNTRCWGRNVEGQLGLGRVTFTGANTNPFYPDLVHLHQGSYPLAHNSIIDLGGVSTQSDYSIPLSSSGLYIEDPHDHLPDYNWIVNLGFLSRNKNQFVEIRQPAYKVVSNSDSSCGVYKSWLKFSGSGDAQMENYIRCWGSNFYGPTDTGVMNNIGWDENFDGTYRGEQIAPCGGPTCSENWWVSDEWIDEIGVLGDSSYGPESEALFKYYSPNASDLYYGYTQSFFNINEYVNFELNFHFSKAKDPVSPITFQNYTGLDGAALNDIDLVGGGHHMCALPKSADTDNAFMCWGANWSGQAGRINNDCAVTIGGREKCATANDGYIRRLIWNFYP